MKPLPFPGDDWAYWTERLDITSPTYSRWRAPRKKSKDNPASSGQHETPQELRGLVIAKAALMCLWRDTLGRNSADEDRGASEVDRGAATLLNIEFANVRRYIDAIGRNHAVTVWPERDSDDADPVPKHDLRAIYGARHYGAGTHDEAETQALDDWFHGMTDDHIKNVWPKKSGLAADLIEHLFRPEVYLRPFNEWYQEVNRELSDDWRERSYPDVLVKIIQGYLHTVAQDPVWQLGALVARTLPNYPRVRELYVEHEWLVHLRWGVLFRVAAGYCKFDFEPLNEDHLVARMMPVIAGIEATWPIHYDEMADEPAPGMDAIEATLAGFLHQLDQARRKRINKPGQHKWPEVIPLDEPVGEPPFGDDNPSLDADDDFLKGPPF